MGHKILHKNNAKNPFTENFMAFWGTTSSSKLSLGTRVRKEETVTQGSEV